MKELENMVNLTDDIFIDFDYLPVDIVVKFCEIYQNNIDEKSLKNPVIASMKLTSVLDKTDVLDDIIKWATKEKIESVKKKVKTKYKINIYLNLMARIEDYLSITDVNPE